LTALVCCTGGNSSEHSLDIVTGLVAVIAIAVIIAVSIWFRLGSRKSRDR
jgi:hypothetical protein